MPDRCDICKQFKKRDVPHVCKQPGPKKRLTLEQERQYNATWQRTFRERHPGYASKYYGRYKAERIELRIQALLAYGGDPPVCACCGEGMLEFLTLDHVGGGGNVARKSEGHKGGTAQYRKLRREGWPEGYQVLCWNCNAAIGLYSKCPHKEAGR